MNPYLTRSLAVFAVLLAYMGGNTVGYLRASRTNTQQAMVAMLEARAELERRNTPAAINALNAGLESQGKALYTTHKLPVGDLVEYGLLGFGRLDQDKGELEDLLARRVFQQNTPLPPIVLKATGETLPPWPNLGPNIGPKSLSYGQESQKSPSTDSGDQSVLPPGIYRR